MKNTTSESAINHLKWYFSRHGIPEIIISDNDPQFSAAKFSKFAEEWGFTHLTSSPHYPQSNGEAERAVQTAKDLITKSEDPYLALLSYRSTPLHNGYSPEKLLIGRRLRSTLPLAPEKLTPKWPETEQLWKTELEYKHKQAEKYNRQRRASVLPELKPGNKVWGTDQSSPAVLVQKSPEPRSYMVKTDQSLLWRNWRHLVETPNTAAKLEKERRDDLPKCESLSSSNFTVTRSDRTVIPPKRLDL